VVLDSAPFIVDGNGLSPSDNPGTPLRDVRPPRCEDEKPVGPPLSTARPRFPRRNELRRSELLSALLTFWRFGRHNAELLAMGRSAGSYFGLGAMVPRPAPYDWLSGSRRAARRLAAADLRRQHELAIFTAWWEHHQSEFVLAEDLHPQVKKLIDPDGTGPRLHSIRRWFSRRYGMRGLYEYAPELRAEGARSLAAGDARLVNTNQSISSVTASARLILAR